MHLDAEKEMMSQCVALLGKFIAVREPNIRYLGLVSSFIFRSYQYQWFKTLMVLFGQIGPVQENMSRMLMVTDVQEIIKRHQAQIITSLKDPDIR